MTSLIFLKPDDLREIHSRIIFKVFTIIFNPSNSREPGSIVIQSYRTHARIKIKIKEHTYLPLAYKIDEFLSSDDTLS